MGKGGLKILNLGLFRKFVHIFMMLNVLNCRNAGMPEKRRSTLNIPTIHFILSSLYQPTKFQLTIIILNSPPSPLLGECMHSISAMNKFM
jgi:hypothetical protein